MNRTLSSISLLATLAFTSAAAHAELPNQWLDAQMVAAKLDRSASRLVAGAAVEATAAKRDAGAPTATGLRALPSPEGKRPAMDVASPSPATDR